MWVAKLFRLKLSLRFKLRRPYIYLAIAPLLLPVSGLEVRQLRPAHQALEQQFAEYVHRYQKEYVKGTEEYHRRLAHYSRSAAEVERLNQRPGRLWTAGTGPLADRSEEELQSMRGWFGFARRGHFTSALTQVTWSCRKILEHVELLHDVACIPYPCSQTTHNKRMIRIAEQARVFSF